MSNNLPAQRMTFGQFLTTTGTQNLIQRTLGETSHAQRFTAAILSAVSVTPALQECDPKTILSGAFLGDALNLSPNPQIGRFYLVPFKDKKNPYGNVAVFVLGFKGYLELAIRTGQYRNINVMPIKEGEITKPWDALTETIGIKMIEDDDKREKAPTVGYYAFFEMLNGFRKAMYWTKDKMLSHADKYSAAFHSDQYRLLVDGKIPGITLSDIQAGKYFEDRRLYDIAKKMSSFWYKDFDSMGCKTMLRQLISKWGILSIDIQRAFDADDHVVSDAGDPLPELPEPPMDDAPDFVQESDKGKQVSVGDV